MFEFDEARILRIFNANGVKMSLKKAFDVARIIYGAHLERLNEVENNAWRVAREEKAKAVEAVELSSQQKVTDTLRQFQTQADNRFEVIVKATLWAKDYFTDSELRHKKIWCIKRVREESPILGLREAKCIVDNLIN